MILYLFLIAPTKSNALSWLPDYDYAHRGLHNEKNKIYENTLSAFNCAVQQGYGIELDLRLTGDNKVVVFHDDSLKRMTGVNKNVSDLTYDVIRELNIKDSEEHIPLFTEVLKICENVPLIIELKASKNNRLLCEKTCELLKDYNGKYVIESFDPRLVHWFKVNAPHIGRGQLSKKFKGIRILLTYLLTNFYTRPHFIAYKYEDKNNLSLKLSKLMGAKTVAWTVADIDEAKKYFDAVIFEK